MSIWDFINPWGALRRARRLFVQAVADYEAERAVSASLLRQFRQLRETAEATAEDLLDEIHRLEATIAKGHFRNPETGCIGPKGVTFE